MTRYIKICGFTRVEETVLLRDNNVDIDYAGVVLAPSKRQLAINTAVKVLGNVPNHIKKVGVFVNPHVEELTEAVRKLDLDVIQLHGDEEQSYYEHIRNKFDKSIHIWKAHSVGKYEWEHERVRLQHYLPLVNAIILDTHSSVARGGTGESFNWERIPDFQNLLLQNDISLFIAGGLHAQNVESLITQYLPNGIDLSSGVETDGSKDITKINEIVEKVRGI